MYILNGFEHVFHFWLHHFLSNDWLCVRRYSLALGRRQLISIIYYCFVIVSARCEPPAPMDKVIYECNIGYSIANEDTQSYGSDGWFSPVNGTCDRFPPHEYCYRGWKELNGYPWVGRANLYGGGGYVAEMRGSLEVLQRFTRKLQADGWVDK